MSAKIEEWLSRMREAREPGPIARVVAAKNGRDLGWAFDVPDKADLGELAERIDNCCRDAGYTSYELRAVDAEGRIIGPLAHRVAATELVHASSPSYPTAVDDSAQHALKASRSFAGLGLQSLVEGQKVLAKVMSQLQDENAALRVENEQLRKRITEQWDMTDKLMSHEVEMRSEVDKAARQGRMAETLTNAMLSRVLGRGATPEGQSIETRMAMGLLRSISFEQANKILPLLADDQRIALMELLRPPADANGAAVPTPDHEKAS